MTPPPARRSVRIVGIVLMIAVSTGLSLAVADVLLDQYQTRSEPAFYTNLTPAELSTRPVKTRGAVDGRYQDEIVDLPFHEPRKSWIWAGQRDRRIEFLVKGRWNNIGCHDDVDYANSSKPAVLFLGDSFVEAMQVDVRDTFHGLLRQRAFGQKFDVWACGVAGWNATTVASYLEGALAVTYPSLRQLADLRPTYVVYFVFMGNDLRDQAGPAFEDAMSHARWVAQTDAIWGTVPYSKDEVTNAAVCPGPVMAGSSALWFRLRQVADMYLARGGDNYLCMDTQFWPYVPQRIPAVEEGWTANFAGLDRINRVVTARGGTLIVGVIEPFPLAYGNWAMQRAIRASYPGAKRVPLDLGLARSRLRAYASARGLRLLDVTEALNRCGGSGHYYPADEHFNAAGHQCLAGYLDAHRDELFR
jgi:hypothetical protein